MRARIDARRDGDLARRLRPCRSRWWQGRRHRSGGRQCQQALQVRIVAQMAVVEHAAVPQRMQVAALAVDLQLEVVAALVVRIAGVHRLMDVADEMHHKLQGLAAYVQRLGAICEQGGLLVERGDHAVAVRAVARRRVRAVVFAQVDVVPRPGAFAKVGVVLAQLIGPRGHAVQCRVRLAGQQLRYLRACLRAQFGFGDARHQAVALRAPGQGGGGVDRGGHCRRSNECREGKCLHPAIVRIAPGRFDGHPGAATGTPQHGADTCLEHARMWQAIVGRVCAKCGNRSIRVGSCRTGQWPCPSGGERSRVARRS